MLALVLAGMTAGTHGIEEPSVPASGLSAMVWDAGTNLPDVFQLQDGDEFPEGAELYLWQGGRTTEPFLVPYGARSGTFELSSGREVVFLKRPFYPEVEDDRPPVAGKVKVPDGVSHALILLVPADLLNNDYQAMVLDESFEIFPRNSLRLVNFTATELAIRLNGNTYDIMPRSSKIVPVELDGGRSARVLVARPRGEGEGHDYITRRISIFDGMRATCFFVENNHNGSLQARMVTEDVRHMNRPNQGQPQLSRGSR